MSAFCYPLMRCFFCFFFLFFMFTVYFHQQYRKKNRFKLIVLPLLVTFFCFYHTCLVKLSGAVGKNPCLTICHWNLNSNTADNFIKIALFKSYLPVDNMNIFRLSETYLDFLIFVPTDYDNL